MSLFTRLNATKQPPWRRTATTNRRDVNFAGIRTFAFKPHNPRIRSLRNKPRMSARAGAHECRCGILLVVGVHALILPTSSSRVNHERNGLYELVTKNRHVGREANGTLAVDARANEIASHTINTTETWIQITAAVGARRVTNNQ